MKDLCPFFGKCGGCLYQDLPWDQYVQKKQDFIRRTFSDHGLTVSVPAFTPLPLGIRRRATFAFQGGTLGYHGLKSHTLVPITECRLLKQDLVTCLNALRPVLASVKATGTVHMALTPFGVDVHIKTRVPLTLTLDKIEELTTVARKNNLARLMMNGDTFLQKTTLSVLPEDFAQPSEEGEHLLISLVKENIGTARKALDLFCGGGTFTRPLQIWGLDVKGYDCSDTVQSLGHMGCQRDLFRHPLTPDEMAGIDLVVLDPPRAGALAQVQNLSQTSVPKIIMISCAPKTAARDISILVQAGWHIDTLTPVDQFVWSNHIELVCVLSRSF